MAIIEYVDVLVSEVDEQFHTRLAPDLSRRLAKHIAGSVHSTMHRVPLQLIYYEACVSRTDTAAREKYLKSGMGKRHLKNRL